ncbi:hypothetical protein POX_a00208 [Penicillium oxalicum]|uniref:hypothetical protein n=1 Tax=Penicillium oxalicum TaxID=69781 RepID=UPI0020B7B394|nr:hypothetical protein POX_a00208 [Penicillium oxalicum]KAI2793626.1 hypothetical protein POX_a00208 [Penicillium oxalicum]
MGFASHLRALSPTSGRHHPGGARASTGMVHLNSSYEGYDGARSRHDYDDYHYPSDVGYSGSYRHEPRHRATIDVQPVSSQKFTGAGHSTKKRTEYAIQPHTRHRSHTASGTDLLYHTPARLTVPSSLSSYVRSGDHGTSSNRSLSPLPPSVDSHRHGMSGLASSRHGKGHRRVYSTDYVSDAGQFPGRNHDSHHTGTRHTAHRASPSTRRHRHVASGGLRKSYNIDDDNAYSYTGPGEEARRDLSGDYSIVRTHRRRGRTSLDRPVSVNLDDGHHQWQTRGKEHRARGPPPTSRGLARIDRERRPRSSSRGSHGGRDDSKTRPFPGHERALVAMPHESEDDYYSDVHRRPRRHRSHRQAEGNVSRSHYDGGDRALTLAAGALGTAALGGGYSDVSDREQRRHHSRHRHRRSEVPRDYDDDSPRTSARDLAEGDVSPSGRHRQLYLEPRNDDAHRRRRHSRRRSHRRSDSDLEIDTDDEDLYKYRREPAAPPRTRHSSTDTSNTDDAPARRASRERSSDRSRSRQAREKRGLNDSQSPLSSGSRDEPPKMLTVEPPVVKEPEPAPVKGILKTPKKAFPEEPNPIREGVAPLKDANKNGIPPTARWTKIDRRLVNPAALEAGNERFEERPEFVIVLRVLTKEEIQVYAVKTQEIRDARREEYERERRQRREEDRPSGRHDESSSTDDEDDSWDEPRRIEAAPAPAVTPSANSSLPLRSRPASHSPPLPERPSASQVDQLLSV